MWEMLESFKPVNLNKREATIVILEEGPGNKGRKCYYGPEALTSGVPIFRGCQVYADHPSSSEQEDLPERSVRDLIGRIKECWVERDDTTGKNQLRGVLKINEGKSFDWAVGLIKESIKAKKEGFPPVAQVSIHADGDINKKVIEGQEYNYVTKIKSAVSVDVVTKGGIKNSGFVEFMENAIGGIKMAGTNPNDRRATEFRRIQAKLAESMTNEEAKFLESYLQEAGESNETEEGGEEGEPEVYQDEEGNLFSPTDQTDEQGNLVFLNEAGEAVVFPGEEIEEPDADDEENMQFDGDEDEDEEIMEPNGNFPANFSGGDEVPISELIDRHPHLAHEINQEEMGVEESDRDYDIVALKLENKLLKSRVIAEQKLTESGLPAKVVQIRELVGKSPEEMDNIIESRIAMLQTVADMTQGAVAAMGETSLRESGNGNDMTVGRRILRNSCMPS